MSGQPVVERVGGSFNYTLQVFEDLNERIIDLERVARMPAAGQSVIGVGSASDLPDADDRPPDWAYVSDEAQWYQVQASGGGTGPDLWSPSTDSPNGGA